MKYVILIANHEKISVKRVYPFIFAEWCTHSEVAKSMIHMVGFETGVIPDVLSAGFCEPNTLGFEVTQHGSESLKIKTDRDRWALDQDVLNMPNALQGMVL